MIATAMREGWQREADAFRLPVYVIRSNGLIRAVTNCRDVPGDVIEIIQPKAESVRFVDNAHGLGAVPGRCSGEIKEAQ